MVTNLERNGDEDWFVYVTNTDEGNVHSCIRIYALNWYIIRYIFHPVAECKLM